jgi:hypothetical protein
LEQNGKRGACPTSSWRCYRQRHCCTLAAHVGPMQPGTPPWPRRAYRPHHRSASIRAARALPQPPGARQNWPGGPMSAYRI